MLPIRQVIDDAPETLSIPPELRHQTIEVIIWPLARDLRTEGKPVFKVAEVSTVVMPSREERNAR